MKFEKVLHGIRKYIEKEMYPKLTSWQAPIVGFAVGRMTKKADAIKQHSFMKMLDIVDENGNVDITELYNDIRNEVQIRQTMVFEDIPLIGSITLTPEDIDKIYRIITAGEEQ